MKKIKLLSVVIAMVCALSLPVGITYAKANTAYDEMDKLFQSTLSEILDYENADNAYISAEKELLYDIDLNPLGLLYSFSYHDKEGFAIIINDGLPQVTEICTNSPAPYDESENTKIYVNLNMYWYYNGADYYDCVTGLQIANESVELISETAFFGSFVLNYSSENVYYTYRSETKYNILSSIPDYSFGFENGCAAVAGCNLVAYYDKTYTNLIPNYDAGVTFLGIFSFRLENATTISLTETLYNDMKTNTTQPGTTVAQFKQGLTTYANRQGYSASFSSLMSSNQINYESAKNIVTNGKGIALFLAGFRTVVINKSNGYDNLVFEYTETNHVAAGFGCLEVNYTLTNNQSRTDKYIHCAMGVGIYSNGYINIATTKINDAYALNIS